MGYKAGIVGLPNVGKSTLFNLLVASMKIDYDGNLRPAEAANFPFCTIEPNTANVSLYDSRLNQLAIDNKSLKTLFANLQFVDIAGLVPKASEGAGLGNKFLANISEVDMIIHVVRCFPENEVIHVCDAVNPVSDAELIILELQAADLMKIENMKKKIKDSDQLILINTIETYIRDGNFAEANKIMIPQWQFLSLKPMVILGNGTDDTLVNELKHFAETHHIGFINFDILSLEELNFNTELTSEEKHEYLADVYKLVELGFKTLNLITFFTVGPTESRAWTISGNTNMRDAAGVIHSDFTKYFIAAEVIRNGITLIKKANDIVEDGDIIEFRINTNTRK